LYKRGAFIPNLGDTTKPSSTTTTAPTPIPASQDVPAIQTLPTPTKASSIYSTPDRLEEIVLNEIFVHSYRISGGDWIGDPAREEQQLEYLQRLGVDAI
jgi:hypothetical protein